MGRSQFDRQCKKLLRRWFGTMVDLRFSEWVAGAGCAHVCDRTISLCSGILTGHGGISAAWVRACVFADGDDELEEPHRFKADWLLGRSSVAGFVPVLRPRIDMRRLSLRSRDSPFSSVGNGVLGCLAKGSAFEKSDEYSWREELCRKLNSDRRLREASLPELCE